MNPWQASLLAALGAVVMAACGGNVVVDIGTGATSGGGGTTSTGTGASPGTTGPGGGIPTDKPCGGKQGFTCDATEWCKWDEPGTCGNADGTGTCQPRPSPASCFEQPCGIVPICGCDGGQYCNPCEANANGVDVSGDSFCFAPPPPPPAGDYQAFVLPTNSIRFGITHADFNADLCYLIEVANFFMPAYPNVQVTMDWSVQTIGVVPGAQKCGPGIWPPPPDMFYAVDAKGSIKMQDPMSFCSVSFDVSMAFPPGPGWVPPGAQMIANDVFIEGMCVP